MTYKPSSKLFTWYYGTIIAIVLLVGTSASFYTYHRVSTNTQDALLKNAASVAAAFNSTDIANLSGSEDDLANPTYAILKEKLEKIRSANDQVRFVYFLGYRNNEVFFYMDSEPATSEDYSPPGQIYDEATDLDKAMLIGGADQAIEFSSDRWGSWLTSLVTIRDGERVVALMGMDVMSEKYKRTVYASTAIPIITTLFVMALILIGFFLRRKENEYLAFKEKLVSVATHDLRSPLTGIAWLTETTLINKNEMRKEDADNIQQIHEKVTKLLKSVNALLAGDTGEKK